MDESFVRAIADLHAKSFGWALTCAGARRRRGADDDASEILQETYEKILSGKARYEGRSSLRTWLFGVIRLTALEHRRKGVLRVLWPARQAARETPPNVRAPDSEAAGQEVRRVVRAALAALSPKQREVMHLVFYEDLTIAEAADVMGVAVGTARLHYDRGKKALAEVLRARGWQDP